MEQLTSNKEFLPNEIDYDDREITQNNVHVRGLWDRTYINAQALNFQSLSKDISQDHLPSLPYVTGRLILASRFLAVSSASSGAAIPFGAMMPT